MKSNVLHGIRLLGSKLENTSFSNYRRFLHTLLRSIDSPWQAQALGLLRAKNYQGLLELADELVDQQYSTATDHFVASQFAALVRKYPWPKGSISYDPEAKAIKNFELAERNCARINKKFRMILNGKIKRTTRTIPHLFDLDKSRRWIAYALGPKPDLRSVYSLCGFGPGASVGIHGNKTNFARKILAKSWTVSPGAIDYARSAMISDPHIMELLLSHDGKVFCLDPELFKREFLNKVTVVDYNKITFVPKTVKVQRTIAVEPLLNGFVQKGVDLLMRKKLKRVGINLSDQSVNQEMARKGSLPDQTDPYVTIDLSSASDSISIELCRYLLPPEWFDFLNSLRSWRYLLKGKKFTYEKFTSMGNGFCFPLETAIFASLCAAAYDKASLKHDFSVYGDDIIVRQSAADHLLKLLKMCGFKVNRSKSFTKGPFRESCGADWFEGKDVRPVTLDYAFDSFESIVKFCNIARSKEITAIFFHEALELLESLIPPELKLVRPYRGNPETALEVPLDVFMHSPFAKWDRNVFSWSWAELVSRGRSDSTVSLLQGYNVALTMAALAGTSSDTPFTERRNTRTKVRRLAYSGATSTWLPA